jgi:hypothetical protein
MKQFLTIAAALLAGFLGGVVGSTRVARNEAARPAAVLRARSFELVDGDGRAISYWGVDKRQNVVLAFASDPRVSPSGAVQGSLEDPYNQRVSIGVVGGTPALDLRAPDGKTRLRLCLSIYEKPILIMEDATGKRVHLGLLHSDTPSAEDNDWGLSFEPDRSLIGMHTVKEGGQTYLRGSLFVSKDKLKYPYDQRR